MTGVELAPDQVIAGRYRLGRRLGAGGMGAVYEAQHVELGRTVAVKLLLPEFSSNPGMAARFMREARAAAQIGHPGIVQVFDLGTDGESPFLVMEKLEGEELGARIGRASPLPVDWVIGMATELCDALQAAHDHGIVHRDLKPSNVFLARQGRRDDVVKVLDFGIAKLLQRADDVKTTTGQVFGTPSYMAPEQLRDSKEVDGRADVYAIGCVLFQALVGHPPFEAATYPDLIFRICSAPRPRVDELRGDVPRSLSELIVRALALDPGDRPLSPSAFAQALGSPALHRSGPVPLELASAKTEAAVMSGITPPRQTDAGALGARRRAATLGVVALGAAATLGAIALRDGPSAEPAAGSIVPPPSASAPTAFPVPRLPEPTPTLTALEIAPLPASASPAPSAVPSVRPSARPPQHPARPPSATATTGQRPPPPLIQP